MTYPYYASYNTCGWEDSLSLLSQEQTTIAHADASGPPAVYPSGYPTQQMDALWYEPAVCVGFAAFATRTLTSLHS